MNITGENETRSAWYTVDYADECGHLYYFGLTGRAEPPYHNQRRVEAVLDIDDDGVLAGIELIDNMPPAPSTPPASAKNETGIEPVAYASMDQLLALVADPEGLGGVYIPLRKTQAGLFQGALYSATQLAEITRQLDEALEKVAELDDNYQRAHKRAAENLKMATTFKDRIAALEAQVKAGAVQVKPLAWKTLDNGNAWSNITDVGLIYFVTTDGTWAHRDGASHKVGTTIEEAKAAAQVDFDQRIRSALTYPQAPGVEGEE